MELNCLSMPNHLIVALDGLITLLPTDTQEFRLVRNVAFRFTPVLSACAVRYHPCSLPGDGRWRPYLWPNSGKARAGKARTLLQDGARMIRSRSCLQFIHLRPENHSLAFVETCDRSSH
jgi:hypothetical protein